MEIYIVQQSPFCLITSANFILEFFFFCILPMVNIVIWGFLFKDIGTGTLHLLILHCAMPWFICNSVVSHARRCAWHINASDILSSARQERLQHHSNHMYRFHSQVVYLFKSACLRRDCFFRAPVNPDAAEGVPRDGLSLGAQTRPRGITDDMVSQPTLRSRHGLPSHARSRI